MTALRAELMRLRSDLPLLGFIVLTVLASIALLAQHASKDALLIQVSLLAGLYGTIRHVLAHRNGVVTRAVLLGHRVPVLLSSAAVTALGGTLIGVGATAVLLTRTPDMLLAVPLGASGAMWGLFVGVIVRNYFLAPTVLFAVHIGSALVLESWPAVGQLLPFGASLSMVTAQPGLLPAHLGVLLYLTWLVLAGTLAWTVTTSRDS
ncbi:hypothetical protein SK854_32910 [Lentzea sp. BCCO 10_0061]|uniref:Uncharacterized protein n=1 Tax=Lentzea sokolovensis TaxID=3095429 RepID=A0ABU4V7M0_9PSEU|nr:hypothetical protein [Lentzea sp. BCCO 10_0061]MDX8146956.1 hypothetical protein [Lentzea sp. BCCO 10_0061]